MHSGEQMADENASENEPYTYPGNSQSRVWTFVRQFLISLEPEHSNTYKMTYASSKDLDQLAHQHSLISLHCPHIKHWNHGWADCCVFATSTGYFVEIDVLQLILIFNP